MGFHRQDLIHLIGQTAADARDPKPVADGQLLQIREQTGRGKAIVSGDDGMIVVTRLGHGLNFGPLFSDGESLLQPPDDHDVEDGYAHDALEDGTQTDGPPDPVDPQ